MGAAYSKPCANCSTGMILVCSKSHANVAYALVMPSGHRQEGPFSPVYGVLPFSWGKGMRNSRKMACEAFPLIPGTYKAHFRPFGGFPFNYRDLQKTT